MLLGLEVLALFQLSASATESQGPSRRSVVVPGPEYSAGWLRRQVFGNTWRALWTTPINVPVANLDTLRGGLTAFEKGGSVQSRVLRFRTRDGRVYDFRSVDKSPSQSRSGLAASPPAKWFSQEQISAMFPAGALVVGELEEEMGFPPLERWLAVLPDSPRLAKWREDFKGMLGMLERRYGSDDLPPELPGANELITTDSLFPRLSRNGLHRVNQQSYLAARLLDFVVGDWDRHPNQWSWAGFDRNGIRWWEALPRDRDWALSRFDGAAWDLARLYKTHWLDFGPRYGALSGLTHQAASLDRRLLTELDWSQWTATLDRLRKQLDNGAIARAVRKLPAEFHERFGPALRRDLQQRRDGLGEIAAHYYRVLAEVVDIYGSDSVERVALERQLDGSLSVELLLAHRPPAFRRRFLPGETKEVRLYLLGGPDTVYVRGSAGGIPVRLITGAEADVVVDSTGGSDLHVYADSATVTVSSTGSLQPRVGRFRSSVPVDQLRGQLRNWGQRFGIAPWLGIRPELGAILGAGPVFTTYGFRKVPYESRFTLRVATTTRQGELNADFQSDFRFERPDRRIVLKASLLNADVIRYFGLGNETTRSESHSFHNVLQRMYSAEPVVQVGIGGTMHVELGGLLRWSESDTQRVTLLTEERPYGAGSFTEAALGIALVHDSRDNERVPTRGATLRLAGRLIPALLDVESAFSTVGLIGTAYVTPAHLPLHPTLALRAGGLRVFGRYPFFEAPDIGGRETVRGFTTRRYTGDASVYGNAEIRLRLGESWGLLTLADIGRVFLDGEDSRTWHSAFGGGLWLAPQNLGHMVTATLAGSGERLRFYVSSRFHF